jgi:hypothetical protein
MTKLISARDHVTPKVLNGRVEIFSAIDAKLVHNCGVLCSAHQHGLHITAKIHEGQNLIVASANTIMAQLLQRNFTDYMPFYITMGDGGDLEQVAKSDTGGRVAPETTDTEIRSVIAKLPIVQVTSPASTSPSPSPSPSPDNPTSMWTYVAIARPHEALTTSLNELGVETLNGTLFSHYITPVDDTGRATKYVKSSLEYLVIRWSFSLEMIT